MEGLTFSSGSLSSLPSGRLPTWPICFLCLSSAPKRVRNGALPETVSMAATSFVGCGPGTSARARLAGLFPWPLREETPLLTLAGAASRVATDRPGSRSKAGRE